MRHWLSKWTTWEYLPWWISNVPMYGFWLWFAARARHLVFFSNVNPAIPLGGAMGESKHDILQLLPTEILPKTLLVRGGESFENVVFALEQAGISYPLIAKPDVGERGFLVKKITSSEELKSHLERFPVHFILQEFLTLPVEMTVLFHRFPSGKFGITSVCVKEFLAVEGDGVSSVRELMRRNTRATFQLERFEQEFPEILGKIPASGETLLLEPIGNHCRGTKFLNGNHLIDNDLVEAFRLVCERLPGVLYGRFDLKCESLEALRRGEFKVMELNGVFGEPAHVYDPSFGMWRAYRDFYRHWRILFELSRAQVQRGVHPTPHGEALRIIRGYFRYKKELEAR
ncbi:MAG: D-alanine--D-alanine ligase [Saprospiraceae bacterium]